VKETDTTALAPAGIWAVDPRRSRAGFSIRHLMVATVKGHFADCEGTLDARGPSPPRAFGNVRAATIDTGNAVRDERLRSSDFFDADRFPEIRFASRELDQADGVLRIVGDLTIKDTTRPIEFRASVDAARNGHLELDLRGELSRGEFGIESDELLEAGISDKVKLLLRISLVKTTAPPAGSSS
jgi:polyisoprenoid-binding protein YceI